MLVSKVVRSIERLIMILELKIKDIKLLQSMVFIYFLFYFVFILVIFIFVNRDIGDEAIPEICLIIQEAGEKINDIWFVFLLSVIIIFILRLRLLILFENSIVGGKITAYGAAKIFESLVTNEYVKSIYISGSLIDDSCMRDLGKLLSKNKSIQSVNLGQFFTGNITDHGIKTLASYLHGNSSLKVLNLSGNSKISSESLPILVEMIEKSKIEKFVIQARQINSWSSIGLRMPLLRNNFNNFPKELNLSKMFAISLFF